MEERKTPFAQWLYILVLVSGGLAIARFLLVLRPFVSVAVILLLLIGWLGYGLYRRWQERKAEIVFASSVPGIISKRLRECQQGIEENRVEMNEIAATVKDLERQLRELGDASEEKLRETRRLIEAFQAQWELRQAKVSFLETALRRLRILQHNYQLSETLSEKQEQLKRLQEKNYEDLADLEELRSNIEYDRTYLETLDELSTRMVGSQSISDVKALGRELDAMTRQLNDHPDD